jgi:DNA anti-recombination protein RmuC
MGFLEEILDINAIVGLILTALIGGLFKGYISIRRIKAENERKLKLAVAENEAVVKRAKEDADKALLKAKDEAEYNLRELYAEIHKEVRSEVHDRRNEVQRLFNEMAMMRKDMNALEVKNEHLQEVVDIKKREVNDLRAQVTFLNNELIKYRGQTEVKP